MIARVCTECVRGKGTMEGTLLKSQTKNAYFDPGERSSYVLKAMHVSSRRWAQVQPRERPLGRGQGGPCIGCLCLSIDRIEREKDSD